MVRSSTQSIFLAIVAAFSESLSIRTSGSYLPQRPLHCGTHQSSALIVNLISASVMAFVSFLTAGLGST
jgi:hypothetical protein